MALALSVAGCGAPKRRALTDRDRTTVAAAVGDVVYQCESAAAGYTEGAEQSRLTKDVDRLLHIYRAVHPDEALVAGKLHTTPRRALSLVSDDLRLGNCSAAQAERVDAALGGGR